eukprot:CAMPEP_0184311052 /NCGR_PEP_ID=MMETSP1049-20130417/38061_1 /TAXON_ID=77928 /ORGANISM="Proteomonas sulcata, Strain CCMP704" /LENGTH=492 /DNA_ID=CAMNT_0026626053 /DNA_START=129 /DNA_END=1607 /DNA_ORIENTATION=+
MAEEWQLSPQASRAGGSKGPSSPQREKRRSSMVQRSGSLSDSEMSDVEAKGQAGSKHKKEAPGLKVDDKMTGLALPDVVRELLKDVAILRWDARDGVYEVVNGDLFEKRFNELRKVRNKVKPSGTERPFSRMYNFFLLEQGDKWARTGTRFRPRVPSGFPSPEFLASIKGVEKKSSAAPSASSSSASSRPKPAAAPAAPAPARLPSASKPASVPVERAASAGAVSKAPEQRVPKAPGAARPHKSPVLRAANPKPMLPPAHEPEDLALEAPRGHHGHHAHHSHMMEQTMLGKRVREQMWHHDRILPREMIEATARKLRLLEKEHELPPRASYTQEREHHYHAVPRHHNHHHHHHEEPEPVPHHAYEPAAHHEEHASYHSHHHHVEHQARSSAASYSTPAAPSFHHMPAAYDVHDDFSDGMSSCMSSCVPSPETMMSLVGDFAGSPLDIGESELSNLLSDSPGHNKLDGLAHKEHHTSFLFDSIEDSSNWVVDW